METMAVRYPRVEYVCATSVDWYMASAMTGESPPFSIMRMVGTSSCVFFHIRETSEGFFSFFVSESLEVSMLFPFASECAFTSFRCGAAVSFLFLSELLDAAVSIAHLNGTTADNNGVSKYEIRERNECGDEKRVC